MRRPRLAEDKHPRALTTSPQSNAGSRIWQKSNSKKVELPGSMVPRWHIDREWCKSGPPATRGSRFGPPPAVCTNAKSRVAAYVDIADGRGSDGMPSITSHRHLGRNHDGVAAENQRRVSRSWLAEDQTIELKGTSGRDDPANADKPAPRRRRRRTNTPPPLPAQDRQRQSAIGRLSTGVSEQTSTSRTRRRFFASCSRPHQTTVRRPILAARRAAGALGRQGQARYRKYHPGTGQPGSNTLDNILLRFVGLLMTFMTYYLEGRCRCRKECRKVLFYK